MTRPDPILGIDLGTSNSAVAVVAGDGNPYVLPDPEGHKIIPSVVSFHPNGSVLIGEPAKERRIIDPPNTVYSVKRLMGRRFVSPEVAEHVTRSAYTIQEGANEQPVVVTRAGEFAPSDISAIILDHMRKIARGSLGNADARRAVITVPANFNDAQRQATATAGEIAELVVVRVLNEPTAAALAYGHRKELPGQQTIAVYDFGGGTFDVTILALRDNVYEVLGTAGDTFLGGDDVDALLVDAMVDAFLRQHRVDLRYNVQSMQRLRMAAEQSKCQLSFHSKTLLEVKEIAVGEGGKMLDLAFALAREAFEQRVAPIIEKSFPVCDEAMRLAQVSPAQIDEVVLVGGTTRIPLLRQRVAQYFGREPRTDVNPDEAVALGAALQAAALSATLDAQTMFEAVSTQVDDDIATDVRSLPPAPPDAALGRVGLKKVAVARPAEPTLIEKNIFTDEEDTATHERTFSGHKRKAQRPVLLDVTPRALGVATVGGWCDEIIRRNSQIPIEQTRVFSTAHDGQTSVEIKIAQGESRRFDENVVLGSIVLDKLPPLPRSQMKIAVTFEINTDGILEARAKDEQTGQAQTVQIKLLGAQSEAEVAAARERIRGLKGV